VPHVHEMDGQPSRFEDFGDRSPEDAGRFLLCTPAGRVGRLGTGTVHHIAWRTPDEAQQLQWRSELVRLGYNVTPVIDRNYFHSIYYREPGGVLFEIATDPPGFAIDETAEHLGERLMLPSFLESRRSNIVHALPPLTLSSTQQREEGPNAGR
jgi:glyoxalase family protein